MIYGRVGRLLTSNPICQLKIEIYKKLKRRKAAPSSAPKGATGGIPLRKAQRIQAPAPGEEQLREHAKNASYYQSDF